MQFAIGKIERVFSTRRFYEVTIEVDGKPVRFNIGNHEQHKNLIEDATHGMFYFEPHDQFAFFIPMSEVNVMLTQAYEQARLVRMKKNRNEAKNVVDATA